MNGGTISAWKKDAALKDRSADLPEKYEELFTEWSQMRAILVQSRPELLKACMGKKGDKTSPELTAFSCIICEQEDHALQIMEQEDVVSRCHR